MCNKDNLKIVLEWLKLIINKEIKKPNDQLN